MKEIEGIIGRRQITLLVSDKLAAIINKTNSTVNYNKRIAQMRRCYFGQVEDYPILFSPTFIFNLEDRLDEEQYFNLFHFEILKKSKKEINILYLLFREGRSVGYVIKKIGCTAVEIEKIIFKFFVSLSKNLGDTEVQFG